ncbi:MAG: hypothetical protein J1E02_07345 [Coprobacter sp.]|nr:hypothetical protein [Coprobacter sp.]
MKKGYFSHRLCFGDRLLDKHILYLSADGRTILDVLPFQREISLTTFCEGILFPVSAGFEAKEQQFVDTLQQQLEADTTLPVADALLANPVYTCYKAEKGEECRLYALTSIDWLTGRLPRTGKVCIRRVV